MTYLVKFMKELKPTDKVPAHKLQSLLVSDNKRFSVWFKQYKELFEEGVDYTETKLQRPMPFGGFTYYKEYILTAFMAKQIIMQSRGEKALEARKELLALAREEHNKLSSL